MDVFIFKGSAQVVDLNDVAEIRSFETAVMQLIHFFGDFVHHFEGVLEDLHNLGFSFCFLKHDVNPSLSSIF